MFPYTKKFAVESVTSGHPDKVCDQISDAVLDECLKQDPMSRVAVEAFGSHGMLVLGGEVTTYAAIDYEAVAREVYRDIGYDDELKIIIHIAQQSPEIGTGVNEGGAGDQGMMYGFATDETPEFLPDPLVKVHKLARGLEDLRKSNVQFSWLRPDGKTQITVDNNRITSVLVSCQHSPKVDQPTIREQLVESLIKPTIGHTDKIDVLINPSGSFARGGFAADTGLTGRKLMVDSYGGIVPHGGGCFSGKDATKVDRSGAYMARFAAKNLVVQAYGKKILVTVAYTIGQAEPLLLEGVNEKGEDLSNVLQEKFDFRPQAIIERLDLRRAIFRRTAAYGHFGRLDFPWEKLQ